jgi:phosphatidylglycerol:prolipoprotein diacylglycerol transferase
LSLDPVMFTIGPFAVRWYGFLMSLSVLMGFYYYLKYGRRLGYDEDDLYNLAIIAIISGVLGARLIYVLTNLDFFLKYPEEIIRIDHGGLSYHGALLGGFALGYWYIRKAKMNIDDIADLVIPGLCVGYTLVRLANILNMENMGRTAAILSGERIPAQLIGSAIGLVTLLIHNYLARKNPPPGYLWWGYIFYYSLLRGVIEETVRENPIYLHLFVSEKYGLGAFTLTQLITPVLMLIAWWQMQRVKKNKRL